jgi:hypothetical protein
MLTVNTVVAVDFLHEPDIGIRNFRIQYLVIIKIFIRLGNFINCKRSITNPYPKTLHVFWMWV